LVYIIEDTGHLFSLLVLYRTKSTSFTGGHFEPMILYPPSPFNCSGVRSCNHSLQTFFQPILRHFLNAVFNSSTSFASRRSFWAAFKSSRDAIAGMVTSKYRILLRHALRDYGGQVAPPYAKASAGKLACGITQPSAGKHGVKILP